MKNLFFFFVIALYAAAGGWLHARSMYGSASKYVVVCMHDDAMLCYLCALLLSAVMIIEKPSMVTQLPMD